MESIETRERILNASIHLFSKKGFDATRVDDIAKAANVNKALIYYYFKSKEDIMDTIINSFLDRAVSIAMDFIHTSIVQMIKDGYLDIQPDRLHFISEEAVQLFLNNTYMFCEHVVDFMIDNRYIIRVLMFESLKNGRYHDILFRLFNFTRDKNENPFYKTIYEADQDFTYSEEMMVFKLLFSIIPLVNFAAYYDNFKAITSWDDEKLRGLLLGSFQRLVSSLISGHDILLR